MATEGETQSMNLDSSSLSDIILDQEREANVPIENIRSKVSLTRDAARAISITAFETLRAVSYTHLTLPTRLMV